MVKKMLLPQEIETFYIIPALRKHIAVQLKNLGLIQKDIAKILMVNSSAISQYQSSKRASQIKFSKDTIQEIKNSAINIKDSFSFIKEIQRLLNVIRKNNTLCQVHERFSEIPVNCKTSSCGINVSGVNVSWD